MERGNVVKLLIYSYAAFLKEELKLREEFLNIY